MKKFIVLLALPALLWLSAYTRTGKAAYSGDDLTGKVEILRDKEMKAAMIRIDAEGRWKLFAGPTAEGIDFARPVLAGTKKGLFLIPVPAGSRSYFSVETERGKAILAEEHLPMAGGYNFRDLGGIRTRDGRHVKWGKIIRSDDLHALTEADLAYLSSVPLVSIVDFRSEEEREAQPDRIPASVRTRYDYAVSPGNLMAAARDMGGLTARQADSLMREMNRMMVTDPDIIAQYRKFFALLQDGSQVPLLFHCSAGKDRTGMGAALILFALGVDEETVMENYLASNGYLADKYASQIAEQPQLEGLFRVRREYLQAGIDQIMRDHGSVENYLTNVLLVDLGKMREMYLD